MLRRSLPMLFCFLSFTGILYGIDPSLIIDSGGNTRFIQKLIFTRDGNKLVSVGDDKVVRIWNVQTGQTERTIRDKVGVCADCRISSLALSPDNKFLAVGGKFPGGTPEARFAIHIYDFITGRRVQELPGHRARIISMAFSPDGNTLASGSAYTEGDDRSADKAGPVRLWKLGGKGWEASANLQGHSEAVTCLAFSPDGRRLVSGGTDTTVLLWNLAGETPRRKSLNRHVDGVFGVAFSADNRFIVTGSLDRKIYLWDVEGNPLKELANLPSGITSMDSGLDKDSLRILVGLEDGTAKILALPEGQEIQSFKKGDDKVYAVAFSPTREATVASTGGFNGEIWLWNADKEKPVTNELLSGKGRTIWSVGFARDGNSIAFGTQHISNEPNRYGPLQTVIHLKPSASTLPNKAAFQGPTYRVLLGGKLENEKGYYSAIDKSAEGEIKTRYGQMLRRKVGPNAFVDEPVRLNELQLFKNGKPVQSIKRELATGRTHQSFTFTPDGQYIVSGGEGGYLAIYETRNPGKPIRQFFGHTNDVWAVAVSPDGRFVVSGSSDQTIKIWDIKSERYLLSIFVATDSEWVAWTPQGYYTSSLNGDRYFGWQVEQAGYGQQYFTASQFQKIFYRPDVVSEYLGTGDIQIALEQATRVRPGFQTMGSSNAANAVYSPQDMVEALPPQIQIIVPSDNETVTRRFLKVKILVTSANLPITNVSVSLNGFQKGSYNGLADESQSRKVEMEMMVALKPEANTLLVEASNKDAISTPQKRTICYKTAPGETEVNKPEVKGVSPCDRKENVPQRSRNSHQGSGSLSGSYLAQFRHHPAAPSRSGAARKDEGGFAVNQPPDAPEVKIVEPEESANPIEVSVDTVLLKVLVPQTTTGTNIKVKILVDGEEVHKQNVQPGVPSPVQVPLEKEGDYTITAVAISDGVESQPQMRKIRFRDPRAKLPNLIFLGVGIKGYKNLHPGLRFADKDAHDVAKLLCRLNNSTVFKEVKARVLSNEQVTRANLLRDIKWLNQNAVKENDVRVVLFSGHGGIFGETIPQYYFYLQNQVPDEDPAINSPEWDLILTRLLERGVNSGHGPILLFVDTCRAGAASPKDFMAKHAANGLLFFGASGSDEKANENPDWENGAFTKAVIEGLGGKAEQTFVGEDPDGTIDFIELRKFIEKRLNQLNSSQNPRFGIPEGMKLFPIGIVSPNPTSGSEITCPEVPTP